MAGCEPKYIVITGKPGSGKSTLAVKLTKRLSSMGLSVRGVLTPELRDEVRKRRYGFEVVGISTGKKELLASTGNVRPEGSETNPRRFGRYLVFPENFLRVLMGEIQMGADILLIDEVGPMEVPEGKMGDSWLKVVKAESGKFGRIILTAKKDMVPSLLTFLGNGHIVDIDETGRDLSYAYVLEKATGTEAFLFDLDGVVVDSSEFHKMAWIEFMRSVGVRFSEDDFRRTFGKTNDDILREYFPSLPSSDIKRMSEEKEKLYRTLAKNRIRPIKGAQEILKFIKNQGFRLALVSSTPRENIEFIFDELGLRGVFDEVISGNDIRKGKPDPECYSLAVERLGVRPYRCYVVEDSEHGLEAGVRAGAKCMGLTTTHRRLQNADIIFEDFSKLSEFIRRCVLSTTQKDI